MYTYTYIPYHHCGKSLSEKDSTSALLPLLLPPTRPPLPDPRHKEPARPEPRLEEERAREIPPPARQPPLALPLLLPLLLRVAAVALPVPRPPQLRDGVEAGRVRVRRQEVLHDGLVLPRAEAAGAVDEHAARAQEAEAVAGGGGGCVCGFRIILLTALFGVR